MRQRVAQAVSAGVVMLGLVALPVPMSAVQS